MNFLLKLFNQDKRILSEIEKTCKKIDDLKDEYSNLSDDDLKQKTVEFKKRIQNGETLDDILVEAFATVREAAKRVINEYPYFVQLMGGVILHRGDIAEMRTGEGKTLTSVLPVYLNALSGKGVHIVTVNEYLAERDSAWMGSIHKFLGLTVGLNLRQLSPAQKRAAYECDITYTTNSELGFDYLRDNMVTRVEDRVLRKLNFALVDEVDSILIDESRTPLIISGGAKQTANLYIDSDKFVKKLKNDIDYEIDVKGRGVSLTEEGVLKAEKAFGLNNIYSIEHTNLVHHINQALKANYIMRNDVEYVVEENEVIIVDQNTGRKMPGREYSDGLHQAIQAKEGLKVAQETVTLATITYQNFFRLYDKLAGMTGTAKTEEEEFLSIYNMRVLPVPTNKPIARIDYPDLVYGTQKAKYNAIINEVIRLHQTGQPVLLGTISVETSELLSKYLTSRKIKHEVLNAKNHAREAEIVSRAGIKGSVTIATNMAGRGTDIKINDEVKALGGLAVIGSERHESRRIDNQLRGRSGRQGDPGYSRFYVSLEDELMVRFGSERMQAMFSLMDDEAIENSVITKAISGAQKRVEGTNFDVRKTLLDYDDVLRQQRETIYEQRNAILENENIKDIINNMFVRAISAVVDTVAEQSNKNLIVKSEGCDSLIKKFNLNETIKNEILDKDVSTVKNILIDKIYNEYVDKTKIIENEIFEIEKTIVLKTIDRAWVNHIDIMDKLRSGIHLRSYAQDNPLRAYISEGYDMFNEMLETIAYEVVLTCINLKINIEN